jgi:hypothetical protein
MSKVYKIHPGMGFARVGLSTQGYFLASETPGAAPIDIDAAGNEAAFGGYKDATKIMRRQGARFRVFEYDRDDASGRLSVVREITSADADIKWSVSLTSAKAEGKLMTATTGADGKRTIVPSDQNRNDPPAGFTRADLKASVNLIASGNNAGPAPGSEPVGRIVGKDLFIGEARTDSSGRLVVLAGRGHSASWDNPVKPMREYLNNPGWHDDIADGSVDAVVTLPGQDAVNAMGAWVFTAPPDFAPDIYSVTTLFDIAEQATNVPLPAALTYPQDIEPILLRASNMFFVNSRSGWASVHRSFTTMTNLGSNAQAAQSNRKTVGDLLSLAASQMSDYVLTARQAQILDAWVNGSFHEQADTTRPALSMPAALDRASLEHCVGGGFFPGIEAGTVLRQPTIYSELGRITRGNFTDFDGAIHQVVPGLISARMACPWQADFTECAGAWWPAQRPDIAGRAAAGAAGPAWARGIIVNAEDDPRSHQNMVDHFAQLGVIVKSGNGFTEVDRDPALDTGV